MKKVILLISVVSILFLVGCNKNVDEFENKNLSGEANQNQGVENSAEESENKILSTYRVEGEKLDKENALINLQGSEEIHRYQEKTTIESDGKKFIIACNVIENGNSIDYDVRINNEKFSVFPNRRNVY
ncbi:MAG: hypothetical protein IJO08_04055 [Clostridia bacterium]|nr:hypothetical protein [Clostridia bacterium]